MGFGITAVCTAVGYTYLYTEYGFGVGDFTYTGIVNGGNCSLTLDMFTGDAGSLIDVYNVTNAGQKQLEDIHCNISTALGCNTNYEVYSGLPFQSLTFEFISLNASGEYYATNWTYFILPPVPSQPPPPTILPGATQVQFTTSLYSTEYGATLIGCLVAAGPTVWSPTNIPTTLSSTPSQNSLPYTSYAIYSPTQNTNVTVDLSSMNLSPSTTYDFWALCYNSNGQSAHSILFNQTTSASLPFPTALASSSSSSVPSTSSVSAASSTPVLPGNGSTCGVSALPTASAGSLYTLSSALFPNMSTWPVQGWGGDDDVVVAPLVAPVTLNGLLYPAGSWLWWGTQQLVQISTDQGQTWAQLAYGSDYPAGQPGNAGCAHRNSFNRFYIIGDSQGANASFVWASNNGTQGSWYQLLSTATQTAWTARVLGYSQCVVDMSDNVYSLGQSDVWVSADLGATFVNVTTSSIYSPRTSASSTIWTATAGDIMVMLGGEAPNGVWLNDVWVSQTSARSWIQVTPAAPWQVRGGAALASTAAGVLVMQGGQGYVSGSNQWWTDAWVSLDGAATWTQLSEAAGPARSYPGSLFDPSGYFYVFSGNVNYAWQTGGQKSSLSVLNIQQWAAIVNGTLTYPAGYNPCAPYINFAAAVAPTGGASSSSSAATAASSAVSVASSASAAVSSSSAASASSTPVLPGNGSTCGVSALPTASAGSLYTLSSALFPNMSTWPVQGWGGDDDVVVAPLVAPVTLNGLLYPAGSWLWWGTQQLVQISTDQGQTWAQLAYGSDYPAGQPGNAGCAHRNSFNRFYIIGDSQGANASFVWASNNGTQGSWYQLLSTATQTAWTARGAGLQPVCGGHVRQCVLAGSVRRVGER